MTGTFCSNCGAQRAPGAAFCASCGTALAAPPTEQPAAPATGAWSAPQQAAQPTPHEPAPQSGAGFATGAPQYVPPPVPQPQLSAAGMPYAAQAPQPAAQPAAQPAPAPWGAAATTAPQPTGTPRRNLVDALLAGVALGAMAAISLIGMLLITEGGVGFRETIALILAGVCLAVGGDAYLEAGADSFGSTSTSFGVLPLTITLEGQGLLGWLYAKQLRTHPPANATEALLQGVRTTLVFTACFLPLSLLTRYQTDDVNPLGLNGRLGVGVISTVFGAVLFAVAALGLTWLLSRSTVLPGRVGLVRDKARAPLLGAVAVFAVGLLASLVALIYALVEEGDQMVTLGVALIGAGNGALFSVLASAGVPLNVEGNANSSLLSEFTPVGSQRIDLFTFTDQSAWFWLAPVLLLAAMVVVAAALAVRQNTIEDARREGVRFAGALALVAFLATLLLRIAVEGEGSGDEFSASADGSVMFNPLVAAVVLAVWGVITGLLAPVVATKLPSGFVVAVRQRFGAATGPTPPVA
jgi:hypothetical protein